MASSPGVIELSEPPEALTDPFNSFPLSDPTIILGDIDIKASSPTLPYSNAINAAINTTAPQSSDFLEIPRPFENLSTASYRLTHLIRKRGLNPLPNLNQANKSVRFSQDKSPRDLI
jgi:hypothetical protein